MDSALFWTILLVGTVIAIVGLAILIEFNSPHQPTNQPSETPPNNPSPIRHSICSTIQPCRGSLICTPIDGTAESRCLGGNGDVCLIGADCASRVCSGEGGQRGICRGELPNSSIKIRGTSIVSLRDGQWSVTGNIPAGLVMTQLHSSGDRILGLATGTNQVYLYTGSVWENLSPTFTPPGQLVDGFIEGSEMYLVYRLTNGQTPIYRLINGCLVPFPEATGGLQLTSSNVAITITNLAVTPASIYIAGRIPGSDMMVYQAIRPSLVYTPITMATAVDARNNAFAVTTGQSILVVGIPGWRRDHLAEPVTTFSLTPSGEIWSMTGNRLYQYSTNISAPIALAASSRLFYSERHGISLITPGETLGPT